MSESPEELSQKLKTFVRDPDWEALGRQMAQDYRDFLARPGVVRRMHEAGLLGNGDKDEKTIEDNSR